MSYIDAGTSETGERSSKTDLCGVADDTMSALESKARRLMRSAEAKHKMRLDSNVTSVSFQAAFDHVRRTQLGAWLELRPEFEAEAADFRRDSDHEDFREDADTNGGGYNNTAALDDQLDIMLEDHYPDCAPGVHAVHPNLSQRQDLHGPADAPPGQARSVSLVRLNCRPPNCPKSKRSSRSTPT